MSNQHRINIKYPKDLKTEHATGAMIHNVGALYYVIDFFIDEPPKESVTVIAESIADSERNVIDRNIASRVVVPFELMSQIIELFTKAHIATSKIQKDSKHQLTGGDPWLQS